MISTRVVTRLLHLQRPCWASEKSLLATLRKKTGYTFANCKKALEMHNNDLPQAEHWLRQQAQALGWAKATKLEGRQTSQGLIAVTVNDKDAALVEVNCETDFVARNQEFQKVVQEAARSCLSFVQSQQLPKVNLDAEQLKKLPASDGKSLGDHLALMIGTVGENASLKRALGLKAPDGVQLTGYAHPSGSEGSILLGKIGGVVALRSLESSDADLSEVGRGLCQHIVGMNPKKIGSDLDEPAKDKEDEVCLIHQEYLLDESVTVKQILDETRVEIVDFKRLECGEASAERHLDFIETCQ